jgi:hypothetical protein
MVLPGTTVPGTTRAASDSERRGRRGPKTATVPASAGHGDGGTGGRGWPEDEGTAAVARAGRTVKAGTTSAGRTGSGGGGFDFGNE